VLHFAERFDSGSNSEVKVGLALVDYKVDLENRKTVVAA
jgi:hypothetical protein